MTDNGTYVSETITKIRCFSRDKCKCQLCLVISALCVGTVMRRTLMARFTFRIILCTAYVWFACTA